MTTKANSTVSHLTYTFCGLTLEFVENSHSPNDSWENWENDLCRVTLIRWKDDDGFSFCARAYINDKSFRSIRLDDASKLLDWHVTPEEALNCLKHHIIEYRKNFDFVG